MIMIIIKMADSNCLWLILSMIMSLSMAAGVYAQEREAELFSPTDQASCNLGVPFQLKLGQATAIENYNTIIKLLSIRDSRCPLDVQCFWGGMATVEFEIIEDRKNISNFNLTIGDVSYELAFKRVGQYLIQLQDVIPYPLTNSEIEPSDQSAVLIIHTIDSYMIDSLIDDLRSEDHSAQFYAVYALGSIQDPRAVEPLIEALKDNESTIMQYAIVALGNIRDPRAIDPLIQALKDYEQVRAYAAEALGEIGDPRAIGPLIQALNDQDLMVQWAATKALDRLKAVDQSIEALKDEDESVRSRAADALGEIGDDRAIGPLNQALKDKSAEVQYHAASALAKSTP